MLSSQPMSFYENVENKLHWAENMNEWMCSIHMYYKLAELLVIMYIKNPTFWHTGPRFLFMDCCLDNCYQTEHAHNYGLSLLTIVKGTPSLARPKSASFKSIRYNFSPTTANNQVITVFSNNTAGKRHEKNKTHVYKQMWRKHATWISI